MEVKHKVVGRHTTPYYSFIVYKPTLANTQLYEPREITLCPECGLPFSNIQRHALKHGYGEPKLRLVKKAYGLVTEEKLVPEKEFTGRLRGGFELDQKPGEYMRYTTKDVKYKATFEKWCEIHNLLPTRKSSHVPDIVDNQYIVSIYPRRWPERGADGKLVRYVYNDFNGDVLLDEDSCRQTISLFDAEKSLRKEELPGQPDLLMRLLRCENDEQLRTLLDEDEDNKAKRLEAFEDSVRETYLRYLADAERARLKKKIKPAEGMVNCEVCGKPTASKYKICTDMSCRLEYSRRVDKARDERIKNEYSRRVDKARDERIKNGDNSQ